MKVVANKIGVDAVTLQLFQTGSSETSCTLKHALLDEALNYHFAVTSLNVPLDGTPIMDEVSVAQELFRIERRNVGQDLAVGANVTLAAPFGAIAADRFPAYNVEPGKKFYDSISFVRDVNNYCQRFNEYQSLRGIADLTLYGGANQAGIPPAVPLVAMNAVQAAAGGYDFLKARVSSDGRIVFDLNSHFTNNFYIRFTQRGTEYFGLTNEVLESVPGQYYLVFTTVGGIQLQSQAWVDNLNIILVGNNTRTAVVIGDAPVFELLDHRVSISVESHLPIASSLQIIDNRESIDRKIVEKFFESPLETSISFSSNGRFDSTELARRVYAGLVSFVKKTDRDVVWYRLLTSTNLYFFRFHLYIIYRKYDILTNSWSLIKKRITVNAGKFWEMELTFVSDV
jgi:hypothetical protein